MSESRSSSARWRVRATGAAAQPALVTQDFKRMSLEELLNVEVTTVTRQPEPVGTSAAAVSVITRDDIRRSGVTTIADAVALADGMHVARFNNGTWSTTARGFNGSTPNKLLVMVDGRNAFTPFFTGVFWNTLDYVLEDIERIEVIRGPGATLWGANAVNGVINIITRHTRDTRGTYVQAGGGNEDPGLIEVRHGGGSANASYRVYAKAAERAGQKFANGLPSDDPRRRIQAGLRFDAGTGANRWLFKADAFHSRDEFPDRRDGEWTELNVQGRFNRTLTPTAQLQVQSYYRREYRNIERQLTHHLDTGDVDIQYSATLGRRHNLITGGGARVNRDKTYPSATLSFRSGEPHLPGVQRVRAGRVRAVARGRLADRRRQGGAQRLQRRRYAAEYPRCAGCCRTSRCCGARRRAPCAGRRASTTTFGSPRRTACCWSRAATTSSRKS